jgi:2-polyprenyl-3-methyl-5-hydroxy-6-metoxy-1,4-benzoquinol methylase
MEGIASVSDARTAEDLSGRLFQAALGFGDLLHVYIGDRLGLYRTLANEGPATSAELARRAGIDERYAREWLEQQAVAGILDVADGATAPSHRRFSLPRAYAETLLDVESLNYLSPVSRALVSAAQQMPALLQAIRTGGGVPWEAYGDELWQAQGASNRPLFAKLLGQKYLPAIPGVHRRLSEPGARVADVACGVGWSSIAIARAYSGTAVDGFDLDERAIESGRQNAKSAGVAERVTFSARNIVGDASLRGRYDLVTIFEALHDMSDPVRVLAATREMLAPGGSLMVMDERVAETFTAPGDDVERFTYGWSLLVCLPAAMTERPTAATGTVMRPDRLRDYARDAGYANVKVLPIENEFFRFYQLVP